MSIAAIEAVGLGKRYGRLGKWAVQDCSFRLPQGQICALVGPNGAGKSTLLGQLAGLVRPSRGELRVMGKTPGAARQQLAFLAQEKPLYPQFTIEETLRMGQELNPGHWDAERAARIVKEGDLDPGTKVRELSGGQRTRVALALCLGKQPDLLLLDEPMADLDPLARHQLMGNLLAEAGESGTTVVISSHILAELEGACDYLLLMENGRIRLGGETDELLSAHALLSGPVTEIGAGTTVVESKVTGRHMTALVRRDSEPLGGDWEVVEPTLEELLLAHMRSPQAPALLTPSAEPQAVRAGAGVAA
ncbi:ABC transporter ATP-binding protein [Streptomyces spiroverticillatus]|uniref:ABC transporter ATP-binding protein n=1 Tax=Streptomyces finlayi TaxID=67296 RepID=A0A918WU10_9ACTN|nr:ABC transporter ATP-binding protein [Streptomyces finlayi]GGZ97429.1 ABC transporter ATP-binding protein [Streptomyces spiroverticillatus]GHC82565.1 ABC transporter ATP-binding protein [Streptomyces finlayi]